MKKFALPVTLRPRRQLSFVADCDGGLDQRAGVEIEHRLCVRLVAGARIIATQDQQVADAERRGAEQVALEREPIAVAAGELQHRLDAFLLQHGCGGQRTHVGTRARAIGDVHGVGDAFNPQPWPADRRDCTRPAA